MKIKFINEEEVRQNQITRWWFDVDGEHYCLTSCHKTHKSNLLDADGCPLLEDEVEQYGLPTAGNGSDSDRAIFHALTLERGKYVHAKLMGFLPTT